VSAARETTAILFGLMAAACLMLAAQPTVGDTHALARSAIFTSLAMLGASITLTAARGGSASGSLGLGRSSLRSRRVVVLAVGTIGLSQMVGMLLDAVGMSEPGISSEILRALPGADWNDYALLIIALCVAPGVCEEVLFRGLIQRTASTLYGPIRAVLVSSILFGAVHLDPAQSVGAALLGLYLGAIAYRGNSIRPCITCHVANNAAVLAWSEAAKWSAPGWAVLVASGVAATVGVVALVTARAEFVRQPASNEQAR
jgi:membrane protease YdiL (CAAX protease family)